MTKVALPTKNLAKQLADLPLNSCRYYVTPKSYLDLIHLYISLLRETRQVSKKRQAS